jgi:L-asparagine permease
VRRARRGITTRPSFRLPLAPYSNIFVLVFLFGVVVLMWFDVPVGRATVIAIVPFIALLFGGWFLVRGRMAAVAEEHGVAGDG